MTTAARPTFNPAKGGSGLREKDKGRLSQQVSSRDLPGHLKLKTRQPGQDTIDEVNERDLLAELEEREKIAQISNPCSIKFNLKECIEKTIKKEISSPHTDRPKRIGATENDTNAESLDPEDDKHSSSDTPRRLVDLEKLAKLDADIDFGDVESSDEYDEDEADDEDDSEELMAELNKIKQARAEEQERREKQESEKQEKVRSTSSLESSFSLKRRWDDDVPFKNCAREEPDPRKKLYLNDTLRQDFHKRFMDKYIR